MKELDLMKGNILRTVFGCLALITIFPILYLLVGTLGSGGYLTPDTNRHTAEALTIIAVSIFGEAGSIISLFAIATTHRQRIFALASVYINTVFLFGGLYAAIYSVSPRSFSFSPSTTEGEIVEDFQAHYVELRDINSKLLLSAIAERHEEALIVATRNPEVVQHTAEISIEYDYKPASRTTAYLHLTTESTRVKIGGPIGRPSNDLRNQEARAVSRLSRTADVESFAKAWNELAQLLERRRGDTIADIEAMLAGSPRMDSADFCYFSAVSMTTLGYGDIIPNGTAVRLLVMLQTFAGIFILGFALNLFTGSRVDTQEVDGVLCESRTTSGRD